MAEQLPSMTTVLHTERFTRNMVLDGPELRALVPFVATDRYVKLLFPAGDAGLPHQRTYAMRRWVPEATEMWIDFAVRGDPGLAGTWALCAAPDDEVQCSRPRGGCSPDPGAAWLLLIVDDIALPAIAAALATMPTGAFAMVFAEVDGPEDDIPQPMTAWGRLPGCTDAACPSTRPS